MNKRIEIYSLISGLVFLISGTAKAIDISVFSNVITQYGFGNLQFITPLIIFAEISVGLLLIFQVWQKRSALFGLVLVAGFTIIYAYGFIFNGIENCGCFGKITVLNTSPIITFLRNAILLYLLFSVWRKGENKNYLNKWIALTALIFMCLVAFMSGYTFRYVGKSKNQKEYQARAIKNTALKDFVTTSKDSTYLVFAFSYTCPHCLNSIANLNEYKRSGVVDKVIGLALGDSIIEKKFTEIFQPNFTIKNYSKELFRLTNDFPTAYYIQNDSIVMELSGELPCAYVFDKSVH
ncbi:MAG: DoxX family protein [Paludibacter sp.]|nr:DoxX family protein [Paludibacter sp.]